MALGTSAAAAGLAGAGHPDVLTWGAHFLSAAPAGPVEVHVEVLRVGRTVSTAQVRVVQQGEAGPEERVRLVAPFGSLDRAEPVHRAPRRRRCPSPTSCLPATRDASPIARPIAMLDRLDVRVDPSTAGFAVGRPSQRGVIRAWLRMRDGREPDVAMLPYAVDALMPVAFDLGAPGWAPTMELTGQALGRPGPGLAARRADHRHRGRRPARRGRRACGTPRAASWRAPGSSPGSGSRATSLHGCRPRARPSRPSRRLAELPGIPEQVEAAREACTRLRWHQALRRRIPEAAAESRVRGAVASAELEGASMPVDVVRDIARGASTWSAVAGPRRA